MENKFINFIKDNDIKSNNQAYILSVILCNKNAKIEKDKYLWYKLISIKKVETLDGIKTYIYLYDYFCHDLSQQDKFNIGDLVSFETSQVIGKKCQISKIELAQI